MISITFRTLSTKALTILSLMYQWPIVNHANNFQPGIGLKSVINHLNMFRKFVVLLSEVMLLLDLIFSFNLILLMSILIS